MTPYEEMHGNEDTNRRSVFTLYKKGSAKIINRLLRDRIIAALNKNLKCTGSIYGARGKLACNPILFHWFLMYQSH